MKRKSEMHDRFSDFQAMVENLFDCKIKSYQIDGVENLIISLFSIIFENVVFISENLVLKLSNKMVFLNGSIGMLLN